MEQHYRVSGEALLRFVTALIEAAGTPADIAAIVAGHLVNADLKGYGSHGVYQLPTYLQRVDQNEVDPRARPEVVRQTAGAAVVEGHNGWGQYVALYCMQLAVEKAHAGGLGGVTMAHASHIGRLGEFVEFAAAHGCIGLILRGGGGVGSGNALPYGGAQGALGSNPIAMGVPAADGRHFVGDFATTVYSNGKMQMARMAGATLPPGAIVDKSGQPSTSPDAFFDGGSHLVFGGYKGYAFSLLTCMAGGLAGTNNTGARRMGGTYFQAISIDAFLPLEQYQESVSAFLDGMRSVPPAAGFNEVVAPGDLARRNEEHNRAAGIEIAEPVWRKLVALGKKNHIDVPEAVSA